MVCIKFTQNKVFPVFNDRSTFEMGSPISFDKVHILKIYEKYLLLHALLWHLNLMGKQSIYILFSINGYTTYVKTDDFNFK